MVADIPRLTSVASLWSEAFQRKSFELASDEFLETDVRLLGGRQPASVVDTSASFVFSQALQMRLMHIRESTRALLFKVLRDNANHIVDKALAPSHSLGNLNLRSAAIAACALTVEDAKAPDRTVLRKMAATVRDRFETKQRASHLHDSVEYNLLVGAYAALLAQDLGLLRQLTTFREELQSASRQWAVMRDVATEGFEDAGFLRCDSASVRARIFKPVPVPADAVSASCGTVARGRTVVFRPSARCVFLWLDLPSVLRA